MIQDRSSRTDANRKAWKFLRFSSTLIRLTSGPVPKNNWKLRCLRGEEGVNLIEGALATSILLSMVFGIIEIGMALYTYNFVAEASREASRYAMVHGSSCSGCVATSASIQTYVQRLGYPGITQAAVTATWPDMGASCTPSLLPCNNPGNDVQVTVTYPFPLNIPFVAAGTLSLTSTSQVVISY